MKNHMLFLFILLIVSLLVFGLARAQAEQPARVVAIQDINPQADEYDLALNPPVGLAIAQLGDIPPTFPLEDVGLQSTGQITGMVTAADTGLPLPYVDVNAYDADGYNAAWATTDPVGKYALTGLATGAYRLQFVLDYPNYLPEWYDNKSDLGNANPVSVMDGMITSNINAALEPGGTITGLVTAADTGAPLLDVYVWVYDSLRDYVTYGHTSSSGVYTVTHLTTGSYFLMFEPSGDARAYLVEYYDDKPDLDSADPVAITAGYITPGIDAELTLGGKITGHVSSLESGLPLPYTLVSLIDAEDKYLHTQTANANGDYIFRINAGAIMSASNLW
jgi:hypothetical protein